MSLLRTALTLASIVLIVGGYAASQLAAFNGTTAEYAAKVDTPPVRMLALVLLLGAVALAFVPEREEPKA